MKRLTIASYLLLGATYVHFPLNYEAVKPIEGSADYTDSSIVVHPSVRYWPSGLGNTDTHYVMVATPLIIQENENPCLWFSTDGSTWVPPIVNGDTINPLYPLPTGAIHQSDPVQFPLPNGKLGLAWRIVYGADSVVISAASSDDGISWPPYDDSLHVISRANSHSGSWLMSPSIILDSDGTIKCGVVNWSGSSNAMPQYNTDSSWVEIFVADSLRDSWTVWDTAQWRATIDERSDTGTMIWHFEWQPVGIGYISVVTECARGYAGSYGRNFLATSRDLINWTTEPNSILSFDSTCPGGSDTLWYQGYPFSTMYKSSFIVRKSTDSLELDVWYSAHPCTEGCADGCGPESQHWHIGRTNITIPNPLYGYLCCVGTRDDINGDGSNLDIVDLTCIVDSLFGSGCDQPCPEEADVNGDGSISDIVDLTFVVDYLFGIAPALVQCP